MKTPAKPESFKAALWQTCHLSDQPLKAIADELGVHERTLSNAVDPMQEGMLAARHFPALATYASNPAFLDFLEEKKRRVAYVIPCGMSSTDKHTAALVKEFGELLSEIGERLSDGDVSSEDARRISAEGEDVIRAVAVLIDNVKAKAPLVLARAIGE